MNSPSRSALAFTWLGHATFLFRSPLGRRILVDPWLTSNPACPESARRVGQLDLILVTHGHEDHAGDAVTVGRATGARVIAPYELSVWFQEKGLQNVTGMNPGGTVSAFGLSITMVPAIHSSSVVDDGRARYAGLATGYVIAFEDGVTVYFAGDTSIFGDMRLIADMHRPTIAFLPIGDHYTMGPEQAAKACELLGVRQVVPMHFGTFPALTGTPARLRALVEPRGVQVLELQPGETAS
jgi:L-ascorbate metabolism protein UlaG (beta-lactamase superfamily)